MAGNIVALLSKFSELHDGIATERLREERSIFTSGTQGTEGHPKMALRFCTQNI